LFVSKQLKSLSNYLKIGFKHLSGFVSLTFFSLQQISSLAQTSFPTTKALHTRLHRFNSTNWTICTHVSLLFSPFGAPIGCWR